MRRLAIAPFLLFVGVGCGGSAWDAHAFTALAFRDAANGAKETYRDARREHMREQGHQAQTSGSDIGAAIEAAALEFDEEHADLRGAHALFATASTTYTDLVYAALQGRADSTDAIVAAGRAVLEAYNHVAAILERHGFSEMPELPPGIAEFLRVLLPGDRE